MKHLYFIFWRRTSININGFPPNLVCALILWTSALGLLIGKFPPFLQNYLPTTCPYFHFWTITLVNMNGFSANLVCALILWTSALGLLIGKFRQFLTDLSACDPSILSFLEYNFSKYQWIFSKPGMCIDIVDVCFGTANWQILSAT